MVNLGSSLILYVATGYDLEYSHVYVATYIYIRTYICSYVLVLAV